MDTSALMLPVQADVRIFEELDRLLPDHDLLVPEPVLEELESLADGAGEEATAASVGADLAGDRCRVVHNDAGYADDALVGLASRGQCDYVVTADRSLRDRLLARDVPVITLSGRNKLAVTQP